MTAAATALDRLYEDWLAHLQRFTPVTAATLGDARALGRLDPVFAGGAPALDAERRALSRIAKRLDSVTPSGPDTQLLADVLRSRIAARGLERTLRFPHRRPDLPLEGFAEALHQVLGWPALAPAARAAHAQALLAALPPALDAVEARLAAAPPAAALRDLGGEVAGDVRELVATDLAAFVRSGDLADPDGRVTAAARAAEARLTAHQAALAALPARPTGFRAGPRALARWLREVEGTPTPLPALLRRARRDLRAARRALAAAAAAFRPGASAAGALAALEEDHATAATLVPEARALVAELRAFTAAEDLLTLPDGPPCEVERAPEFLTTLSAACLETPGPLQPAPDACCYYLAAPREDDPPERALPLLRLFNRARLVWVSAHETWPGHFAQWLHAARAWHPLLAIADSEVFIEGWAHYSEALLLEGAGFRGAGPDLRLGVAWARALRLARFVAALTLHGGRATLSETAALFADAACLAPEDAEREALRALADPMVLTYTLGRDRIVALRDEARARDGASFSLRAFHDNLLSRGTAPLPLCSAT